VLLAARRLATFFDRTLFHAPADRLCFREYPDGEWTMSDATGRRIDQALVTSANHAIVQGNLRWTSAAGIPEFEYTAMFGVDRYTRMNLPEYGDMVRSGAFLFPPHTERKDFPIWDAQYVGMREMSFQHATSIDGVEVYVFHFIAKGMDETAGYSHLPDVPDPYHAITNAKGTLWIEPTSGVMVNFEDEGVSHYVEAATGRPLADFYGWTSRYTPETRTAKLKQALDARREILALEIWLPIGLLSAGLAWLMIGWRSKRRHANGQGKMR
jgi:hypothetical protein